MNGVYQVLACHSQDADAYKSPYVLIIIPIPVIIVFFISPFTTFHSLVPLWIGTAEHVRVLDGDDAAKRDWLVPSC
jgi:hypothetical protein